MDETTTDLRAMLAHAMQGKFALGLNGITAEALRVMADVQQEKLAGWTPDMEDPEELRLHAKRLEEPARLRALADCLGEEQNGAFILNALDQAVRDSLRTRRWRP